MTETYDEIKPITPTDKDVAEALVANLTMWITDRAVATGADRALLSIRSNAVVLPCLAQVTVVCIDGERVLIAKADDRALDVTFGGRGRFLKHDLASHLDHLKCMKRSPHGIVDSSKVWYVSLVGADLDLVRWGVR